MSFHVDKQNKKKKHLCSNFIPGPKRGVGEGDPTHI